MMYDIDDYGFPDPSENITDDYDYSLSSEELDQYEDMNYNILDELEYQVRIAEERITLAGWEGATSDEIERLEDELEILMIDYRRYLEKEGEANEDLQ
jgi:hypothetical protein